MAVQPMPITIPAGIVAAPTRKSKTSNWRDGHLMRWSDGKLQPFGGWVDRGYGAFSSTCRRVHRWTTNNGTLIIAYLCEYSLYIDRGNGIEDISPLGPALAPPTPIVGGGGYGGGSYGSGVYGRVEPATESSAKEVAPGYYLDNWGQNLLAMTGTDGRLLMWDPTSAPGTRATAVTNAPTGNRAFVVHPLRHVVVFGAGGVMNKYAWCDQENITNWNFADVNSKAGFQEVQPASPIVAAWRSGDEILFFTENDKAYYIEYTGMPYIFGGKSFASGCTPVSPMAICDGPEAAMWMANGGIFIYQSRTAVPVECAVWNWLMENRNEVSTRYGGAVFVVPSQSEIWFSFSTGAVAGINDRTIVYNYVEKWWTQAYIGRTAGVNATYTGYPIMSDGSSVFDHEEGGEYPGADMPWAETFPITMGGGASLSTIFKFFPDFDGDLNSVQFSLQYNLPRASDQADGDTGLKPILDDGYVYFPEQPTGRDFRLTVKQIADNVGAWTVGDNIIHAVQRGGL